MTSGHDECPACGYGRCPATREEDRPPGCLATLPVAVLAGSRRQFDEFVRRRDPCARRAIYIGDRQHALGMLFGGVERVGDWHRRRDAHDLETLVLSRVRE